MEKPKLLENENIDIESLKKICSEYIDFVSNCPEIENDYAQYIFEKALKTFYGKDIFVYVNELLK